LQTRKSEDNAEQELRAEKLTATETAVVEDARDLRQAKDRATPAAVAQTQRESSN